MPLDLRERLAGLRCWDAEVERVFQERGEPVVDAALQNREELVALAEFMRDHGVRSLLEIGTWTGATARALHQALELERVAVADQGYARTLGLEITLPPGTLFFEGDSESDAYLEWRRALGHVDLVLIDGNHAYHAVKRDFERERGLPHRFLALHDITGARRATTGVKKLWHEIRGTGHAVEIVRPHAELGLDRSLMGIGVWQLRSGE